MRLLGRHHWYAPHLLRLLHSGIGLSDAEPTVA
jgi:hypothetical protein